jgi:predicted DsbA family dithiol-disulfide isomerase
MEIHPETPPEGRDMSQLYPAQMQKQIFNQLNVLGKDYGIQFKANSWLANSRLSLLLSEHAKETGVFGKLHQNLFQAYFEEGINIGNRENLLQLAGNTGLSREEAEQSWQNRIWQQRLEKISAAAQKDGVTGVPTFIINEKHRITGAQPYKTFQDILQKLEKNSLDFKNHRS